jgi:hypothetical protein
MMAGGGAVDLRPEEAAIADAMGGVFSQGLAKRCGGEEERWGRTYS